MIDVWTLTPNFQQKEFDSPDVPGSGAEMKPQLLVMLEALRRLMGKSMVINSGFRSVPITTTSAVRLRAPISPARQSTSVTALARGHPCPAPLSG